MHRKGDSTFSLSRWSILCIFAVGKEWSDFLKNEPLFINETPNRMARIKQVGPSQMTSGTIGGLTYVTCKNGTTYVRSTPVMPAKVYQTPAAKKRQALFKLIQMHLRHHLPTLRQTFAHEGPGSPSNSYFKMNNKALREALDTLAERMVAGELVTISEIEAAICAYAAENPGIICIASMNGFKEVFLTGEWPDVITLCANRGNRSVNITLTV